MKHCITLLTILFISHCSFSQDQVELYYLNGQVKKEGALSSGLPDGIWREYREDGSLIKESKYDSGTLLEETWYDSRRIKQRSIMHNADDSKVYRQFTKNGMLRAMADINPDLITDSAYVNSLDRGFVTNLCNDQGSFVSNAYYHPHGNSRAFPSHTFHNRSKLQNVTCGSNSISWHRYSGLAKIEGYYDSTDEFHLLEWPERGLPDDPLAKQFDKNSVQSKLKSYFINGLPYGNWLNYYPTGQLWYSITYKDGLPDGMVQTYYHKGQQMLEARFSNGRLVGTCTEWYAHGQMRYTGEYDNGQRIGVWTYWTADGKPSEIIEFDKKGQLIGRETYHDNGMMSSRTNNCSTGKCTSLSRWNEAGTLTYRRAADQVEKYSDAGLPTYFQGPATPTITFHDNGKPKVIDGKHQGQGLTMTYNNAGQAVKAAYSYSPTDSIIYRYTSEGVVVEDAVTDKSIQTKTLTSMLKNPKKVALNLEEKTESGLRNGNWTLYYPAGKKWSDVTFNKGLQNGQSQTWSISGETLYKGGFENGLPTGRHERKSANGQLISQCEYASGLKNGSSKAWSSSGTLIEELAYKNGLLSGPVKRYNNQGLATENATYKASLLHGRATTLNEAGQSIGYVTYENGTRSGEAELTLSDGGMARGNYVGGYQQGNWTYSSKGKTEKVYFVQGREQVEADPQQCVFSLDNPLVSSLDAKDRVQDAVDFSEMTDWTNSKLEVNESSFKKLYFENLQKVENGTSMDIVTTEKLVLRSGDFPGFGFDLTPLQLRGEYSKIPMTLKRVDYFLRDFPRFKDGFGGQTMDYFHLGLDHYNMDEVSMMDMTRDLLMDERALDRDSTYSIIYEALIADKVIQAAPTDGNNQLLSDVLMDNADACRESLFKLIFGSSTVNIDEAQTKSTLNAFFSPLSGEGYTSQMDKRIGQFTADLRPTSFALEMPAAMISKSQAEPDKGARLMMKVNLLRFNTQTGMSIISASDFCFAEGQVGGSAFSVDIDMPEVVMRPRKLRELIPNTQDYYFYAENLGLEFSGVFAAEAMGQFSCENGEKIFLEYANIGVTEKYFAGRLTINIPDEHRHEIFRKLEDAFTYHEIISEWGTVLEIYFMRLKPKTP